MNRIFLLNRGLWKGPFSIDLKKFGNFESFEKWEEKMESITKCLATNIRKLRKERDLTQTDLAERAGISLIFLQGIESERKWVSPATAKSLAQALEVPESKLFESSSRYKSSSRAKNRNGNVQQLNHLPDDILNALHTTCRQPDWKWEAFRWIIQGYERESGIRSEL